MKKLVLVSSIVALGLCLSIYLDDNIATVSADENDDLSQLMMNYDSLLKTLTDIEQEITKLEQEISPEDLSPEIPNTTSTITLSTQGLTLQNNKLSKQEVLDLQTFLKNKGFLSGGVTGIYDSSTQLAVKNFQEYRIEFNSTPSRDVSIDKTITISYRNTRPAQFVSSDIAQPFSFKGGAYPGIGGTCKETITSSCTIVLTFDPSKVSEDLSPLEKTLQPGSLNSITYQNRAEELHLTYKINGESKETKSLLVGRSSLTASLDIDFVNFGTTLINTTVTRDIKLMAKDGEIHNLKINLPEDTFNVRSNSCTSSTLSSNTSCAIRLTYSPSTEGLDNGHVTISYNNGIADKSNSIELLGEGHNPSMSDNVLLVYNNQSKESTVVKDYYLSHRPNASQANILDINFPARFCIWSCENPDGELISKDSFRKNISGPIINWLKDHRQKDIRYIVFLSGIPTRFIQSSLEGGDILNGVPDDLRKEISKSGIKSGGYYFAGLNERYDFEEDTPFVNYLYMGSLEATKAYIDKLKRVGDEQTSNSHDVISALNTEFSGSKYYLEDAGGDTVLIAKSIRDELLHLNPNVPFEYRAEKNSSYFSLINDVAGFVTWGRNGGRGGYYMFEKDDPAVKVKNHWFNNVKFTGKSAWYLLQTIESFNGMRSTPFGDIPEGENYQGNFVKWFSSTAFGGHNYSNTPVGAVAHIEEPGINGVNGKTYFSCWESGQVFAQCAWNSQRTNRMVVFGDPLVKK